jgi:hypothetical protein
MKDIASRHAAEGSLAARVILRAEGLVALGVAVVGYRFAGGGWPMFAWLFLLPDVTMVGYLANPRVGAWLYNAGHTYVAPALLALAGVLIANPSVYSLALIWVAHIGFDRVMGYGLKYPVGFRITHLSGG